MRRGYYRAHVVIGCLILEKIDSLVLFGGLVERDLGVTGRVLETWFPFMRFVFSPLIFCRPGLLGIAGARGMRRASVSVLSL